jgi:hypothetical protein
MTVIVKKHGLDDFEPFDCTCKVCGCLVEVTEAEDLKIASYNGVDDGPGEAMIYVDCPDCYSDILCPDEQQKLYTKKVLVMIKKK